MARLIFMDVLVSSHSSIFEFLQEHDMRICKESIQYNAKESVQYNANPEIVVRIAVPQFSE